MLNTMKDNVPHLKKLHVVLVDVPAILLFSIMAFKAASALSGYQQRPVPERELTKPIFGYSDGKSMLIASTLIEV